MKNFLVTALITLLFCSCSIAISVAQNRIIINRIGLIRSATNTSLSTNLKVCIGDDRNTALAALGSPSKSTKEYLEIEGKNAEVLLYGDNKLYFVDGKLFSYEIKEPGIELGDGRIQPIHVGSPLNKWLGVPYILDLSYQVSLLPGTSRNIPYAGIMFTYFEFATGFIGIQQISVPHDGIFEVLFDENDRVKNIYASY